MRLIARMLTGRRLKTVSLGLENLPQAGPALIVARHYHHLFDGLVLFAAIERRFHIVVTLDWAKNQPSKLFMQTLNWFARWPILLREDALMRRVNNGRRLFTGADIRRYQWRALRQSVELLCAERVLVIFPEGYPNVDPNFTPKTGPEDFLPFKPGFANIAAAAERRLSAGVPIIPAGLHYENGDPWIGYLTLGKPVYRDRFSTKASLVCFLEQEVKKLSTAMEAGSPS